MRNKLLAILSGWAFFGITAFGQTNNATAFGQYNVITTAVPFLIISPDSRSGGMGDVGVSTSPDNNSLHWNVAKLAFLEDDHNGLSMSYTPWLSRLVPDIDLAYLSYSKQIGKRSGLGLSLRYFSLGEINLTDENGNPQGTLSPNEFAIDGGYSLQLSEQISLGVALRYIYSNLAQSSVTSTGSNTQAGQSFAADVGAYYRSREINLEKGQKARYSIGFLMSNIGAKVSYSDAANSDFLPTNLRFGGTFDLLFDQYNSMAFTVEMNKLLVPTPPLRDPDTGEIIAGEDNNVPPFRGIFQSFSDAPGGSREELREIIWNTGVEYNYSDKFFLRGGYQYEHETKGNRKYFTLGLGIKYNVFGLDFAYLIPATPTVQSPLENTLRFTLYFGLGGSEE
jgi:hypothetical protein